MQSDVRLVPAGDLHREGFDLGHGHLRHVLPQSGVVLQVDDQFGLRHRRLVQSAVRDAGAEALQDVVGGGGAEDRVVVEARRLRRLRFRLLFPAARGGRRDDGVVVLVLPVLGLEQVGVLVHEKVRGRGGRRFGDAGQTDGRGESGAGPRRDGCDAVQVLLAGFVLGDAQEVSEKKK